MRHNRKQIRYYTIKGTTIIIILKLEVVFYFSTNDTNIFFDGLEGTNMHLLYTRGEPERLPHTLPPELHHFTLLGPQSDIKVDLSVTGEKNISIHCMYVWHMCAIFI